MLPIKHLSPSSVDTFFRCGEQWKRRYVDGDKRPPGIAAHIGSGVHGAAEHNHLQKIQTRRDEPLDVLQDKARDSFLSRFEEGVHIGPDDDASPAKLRTDGIDAATKLTKLYRDQAAPNIWPYLVEEKVYLELDSLPIPVLGILDLATEDGSVLDLKTTGRKWSQAQADHNTAMSVYPTLYQALTGEYPARLGFEVFVNKKSPEHQQLSVFKTSEDFDLFVHRAQIALDMIALGIFPPAQPGAWNCSSRFCGYWDDCPHIPQRLKDTSHF